MNKFIKDFVTYFSGENTTIEFEQSFKMKSGTLGQEAVKVICRLDYCEEQSKNNSKIYDFESDNMIYEVKNFLFNSQGTAHEKLLYDCWKYAFDGKDVIMVLCGMMEYCFQKQLYIFVKSGNFYNLLENNVFIVNLSDIIDDKYFQFNHKEMLKWVGSKLSIKETVLAKINELTLDKSEMIYIEPFIGSGIVLKTILESDIRKRFKKFVINDVNKHLITLFKIIVSDNLEKLIEMLLEYQDSYNTMEDYQKESLYYSFRDLINNGLEDDVERVGVFMFLNKTCFRGLFRVNSKGMFNVPFGNYKNITFNIDELRSFRKCLKEIDLEIYNEDYQEIFKRFPTSNSNFIYLDPPYINTYDSYFQEHFDSDLFKKIVLENRTNDILLISNSKDFVLDGFKEETLEIQQKINSKMPNSKRIEKLLYRNV